MRGKRIALRETSDLRIACQPLDDRATNRAALAIANTRTEDATDTHGDSLAEIETVLRHFVIEYLRLGAPSHRSRTNTDGPSPAWSLTFAVASTALAETGQEAILELVKLLILLLHLVQCFVI